MTRPKKIILIVIDTLRADHLGCYGYKRNTSPNIDELCKGSIKFEHAFSPSSFTIPAHGSIFTSKYPSNHSIGFNQGTGKLDTDLDITLAETISSCGYATSAFVSGLPLRKATNFDSGFMLYDDDDIVSKVTAPDSIHRRSGSETTKKAITWIENNKQKDFFLFIHYFDVHGPYICPQPHNTLFLNDRYFGSEEFNLNEVSDNHSIGGIPPYQLLSERNIEKCRRIGNDFSQSSTISGWHGIEDWEGTPTRWIDYTATLVLNSEERKKFGLNYQARSFSKSRTIEVYVNENLIAQTALSPDKFTEVREHIDLEKGGNLIRLHVPEGSDRPCDSPELESTDIRFLSVAIQGELIELIKYEKDARYYISQYDGCINHCDIYNGQIFSKLKELKIYDDTLIVLTSDHGEAFGENNVFFSHGLTVTLDQISVPLIIKPHKGWRVEPDTIDLHVSTIDIMPTILSLCEYNYNDLDIEGKSLKELIEGKSDQLLRDRTLISETEAQYAFIQSNKLMELKKKDNVDKTRFQVVPELIDSLNGMKYYWDLSVKPEVSVILPTYNRGNLIGRAIKSVLDQTYRDFELIVVDTASTDDTMEVVRSFKDNRVKYIRDEVLKGVSAARNIGINVADGKFLAFQDSDDEWLPKKLEMQVQAMDNAPSDVGVVYSDMERVHEDGTTEYWHSPEIEYGGIINKKTLDYQPWCLGIQSTLIRRKCFDEVGLFDESFLSFEDLELFMRLSKKYRFIHITDPLVRYYATKGISTSISGKIVAQVQILEKYIDDIITDKDALLNQFHIIHNLTLAIRAQMKSLEQYEINASILEQEITQILHNLKGRDSQITALSGQLQETSSRANDLEQAVVERDSQVALLADQLQESSNLAKVMEQAVVERDSQVALLTGQLQESSNLAKAMEQAVVERDSQVALLTGQLQESSNLAKAMEQAAIERDSQVAITSDQLKQANIHVATLELQKSEIQRSIVWRTTMGFHNGFVERALPHGTKRRRCYDLGLNGGRILANEGPQSLWRHYNERKKKGMELQTKNKVKEITYISYDSFEDIDSIVFPKASEDCDVSIVIPVYNNVKFTYNCLKSLSEKTKGAFEVVVVDDASVDGTDDLLKHIENIKIIKNKKNQGFIESSNSGAKSSKGKYILFLNNDTIVTDKWLEPLVEAIKGDKVGIVGAKLIYPDGRLQEAGGIIWNDASGWNYGRGDDPQKPEYNFARDVDYCSGAVLLVRKDLFERYGGFDDRFKPAYYEDTDLCFHVRNMGYRVLYEPRSVVFHVEGVTSGNDVKSGAKRYQEINKTRFFDKWRAVLDKEHYGPDSRNLFPARIHRTGKNILVIDHYVPTFDKDSGSYRMYNFLKILVDLGHKVTFIGDNLMQIEPYTSNLQQLGIEVIYHPFINSIAEYLAANGGFFDIVILSRSHIAVKHIHTVKKHCSKARIVFDTVDLQFLREQRRFEVEKDNNILKGAEKLKEMDFRLAGLSDLTLVVSPIEKTILLKENPSLNVEVISNIHFVNQCKNSFSERRDLMFIGGFAHTPNVDAVKWFVREIFPIVKEHISEVKFYVVGSEPPAEIKSLASDDVIVTGYMEDLAPYFDNCRVFVAPLRYGAGVKGKINQSMSYGLPVVTTSIGSEGMELEDGLNALIADEPRDFANKVVSLYEDKDIWCKISINSIDNVRRNYSYEVSKEKIKSLIEGI